MDLNATYKRFAVGSLFAYYSYIDNVDEEFVLLIPGVGEDRESRNYKGDLVWNLKAAYDVKDKVSFSFIINNVLNNEYALRPSKQNAPRSFTLQSMFVF